MFDIYEQLERAISVERDYHRDRQYVVRDGEIVIVDESRRLDNEAEIVARAGEVGTVATNMAGRGTDIRLGEGVPERGGIHVICTELHESARIDRQLIGRCGRQGDPGSFRHFMAMDDEILQVGWGLQRATRMANCSGQLTRFAGKFRAAQARVEGLHFRQRRQLLHHEKQRRQLQRQMGQDPYLETAAQ